MKGPSLGRRLLITAGYSTFFLFAFALFVYATLPLDSVRAFMVRKAADEYGADLEITDLSTWGLSGLKAEGVTVRFRPSPEEQATLEAAREARKAWDAAHAGGKPQRSAAASDGSKPAPGGAESAAKAGAEPIAGDVDDERDPEGAEKRKLEAAAGAPPSVPAGPLPVTIESLKAKVGLIALLRGARAGAVEASLAGGTLEAELDHGGDAYHLTGKWDALDLRQFAFLRRKFDLPLAGTLAGEVDVEVPATDTGKPRIPSATGHIALKVADAAIGPGKLALKSGGFDSVDVPLTRIAGIDGKFVLEKKKATIDHFDITGKDIEGELTGYVELKDAWAKMGPRAHVRFKLTDEFLEAHKDIKVLVTSLPKLKSATSEGYIGLLINGTMADPKVTPRKDSPYKAGAKAAPGDARKTSSKERKPAKPAKPGATTTPGGGIGKLPSGATPTTSKTTKDSPASTVAEPAPAEPESPAAEPVPEIATPEPVAEEPEAPAPAEPEPAAEAPETPPEAAAGGSNENPEAPADPGTEGAPEE